MSDGSMRWFSAQIGDRMIEALKLANDNGPYGSMSALAGDLYEDDDFSKTTSPIVRCLRRGLLDRQRDHEARHHKSHGAIVITEDGRRVLGLYGLLDDDSSDDTPE